MNTPHLRTVASDTALQQQVVGAHEANQEQKKGFWRKFFSYCKPQVPRDADGWSSFLGWAAALMIPLWFFGAHFWNSNYYPVRDWVWMVWPTICLHWVILQLGLLAYSAARSAEEIGLKQIFISLLSMFSAVITATIIVVMWAFGAYRLGTFQVAALYLMLFSLGTGLGLSMAFRFIINKRYFANIGGTDN